MGCFHRFPQLGPAERTVVERGVTLPGSAPVIEMLELDVQHRRLQLIDAEIATDEGMVVLGLAAVHPQDVHPLRQGGVVGDAHPGIAEGAQVLGRKE